MAEYSAISEQLVSLNNPVVFTEAPIPCTKGYVYHEDGTGIFTLRGITNNCFARYQVTFNGNVAIPEGGTAGTPIAVAVSVQGEPRQTSRAIFTPAAAEDYGNLTSTAIVTVPRGCCFSLSVRAVPGSDDPTVTPAPSINVLNANLVISRIA
jgi:hypothetical protein